jgi:ABC-2 type transport system ATP-binding protein
MGMAGQVCIEISDVYKRYKSAQEDSLSGVSLDIMQSDVFGLLGPNGAGKTTLISILCGIIPVSSGDIQFFHHGRPYSGRERKSRIGFVPQEYAFYQELTPRQNLDYFGAMYNLSKKKLEERREHLLEVLGLEKAADKKIGTFSGGMKRRVNLAIGIIHEPQILFSTSRPSAWTCRAGMRSSVICSRSIRPVRPSFILRTICRKRRSFVKISR